MPLASRLEIKISITYTSFCEFTIACRSRTQAASQDAAATAAHLGATYRPRAAVDLLLRMMTTFCVLLCDRGHRAKDAVLNGYCALHRVLLAVLLENNDLVHSYRYRLRRFLREEMFRHKSHWGSLGDFNLLAPLFADELGWKECLETKLEESAARRSLWLGKAIPGILRGFQTRVSAVRIWR